MNVGIPANRGKSSPDTGWKNASFPLVIPSPKRGTVILTRRFKPSDQMSGRLSGPLRREIATCRQHFRCGLDRSGALGTYSTLTCPLVPPRII
jgi:hypothetical protein